MKPKGKLEITTVELLKLARKDIKKMIESIGREEARDLVSTYYQIQGMRKIAGSRTLEAAKADLEHDLIGRTFADMHIIEGNIYTSLDEYSKLFEIGRWARSITGVGPVISAGLIAHIDIHKAPTVGHIWRFAGLDPTVKWLPKTKRPWNADLKVLCYKIGESFVKTSGLESDIYGHLWEERKDQEWAHNLKGDFANQAEQAMREKDFRDEAETLLWLKGCMSYDAAIKWRNADAKEKLGLAKKLAGEPGSGIAMLSPAHIHARARRWTVKLFLAHWHHVAYECEFHTPPPKPYVIEHLGHAHFLAPPNWPMEEKRKKPGKEDREAA